MAIRLHKFICQQGIGNTRPNGTFLKQLHSCKFPYRSQLVSVRHGTFRHPRAGQFKSFKGHGVPAVSRNPKVQRGPVWHCAKSSWHCARSQQFVQGLSISKGHGVPEYGHGATDQATTAIPCSSMYSFTIAEQAGLPWRSTERRQLVTLGSVKSLSIIRSPFHAGQEKHRVVGAICPSSCGTSDTSGGRTRFPRLGFAITSPQKITRGGKFGFASNSGVPLNWGSKGSTWGRHQISGSLVCNSKTFRNWKTETAPHFGLQRVKQISGSTPIQARPLERHLPVIAQRHVGHKSGSKECIFSPRTFSPSKTFRQNGHSREDFSNGRGLFWPEHPPLLVDASNVSIFKKSGENRASWFSCIWTTSCW